MTSRHARKENNKYNIVWKNNSIHTLYATEAY